MMPPHKYRQSQRKKTQSEAPFIPPQGLILDFLSSPLGRDTAREGGRKTHQLDFQPLELTCQLHSNRLQEQPRCDMDISAAVSHLSVSLTNTSRGLIKLNLALLSSNSLTQNQFKKGKIRFVSSAFFDIGLKAFKYRKITSES